MRPLLLVGVVLALATPAAAQTAPLGLSYAVRDQGGLLIANGAEGPVTWERCVGDQCAPHDDGDGRDEVMNVADDPVGSIFKATRGGSTVASEPWGGRLAVTTPPSVEGEVRVGGAVRALPATWSGGWGRESDWLQLQVCSTADGAECLVISDEIKYGSCRPEGGRVIPARYEGLWLRAADTRIDRNANFTKEGYFRPEGVRPNRAAANVAVAPIGRIGPGPAPATDCGTQGPGPPSGPTGAGGPPAATAPVVPPVIRPSATVRTRMVRAAGRRLVAARIRCPVACRVQLRVRQGRRVVLVARRLPRGGGEVALPRLAARKLRPGRVGVRVRVDGRTVAERGALLRG